ncbi:MAG: glutaredoxin family protein [Thiobacillus sp.]|jgi:glutaredoxin|uniref:glutaredoxin family protein n=1 Tax=Thiobacillus sp. TaxID=924 RepID=UPI0028948070|nr:glutaredoxin family protein [Thiobacillus sp.]MDT3705699.1 glutaredoxin family protein [Thiobacillus sp.]
MKTGLIALAIGLAAASTPLAAVQLYQWKDAQGHTVYSDLPPPTSAGNIQQKNFKGSVIEGGEPYATKMAREKHPVTLYTSACGAPCDQARQLLSERGIPHSSKDLQASEEARKEVEKLTGRLNVPILMIGSDKIEGFEAGRWHAALDQAGYPRNALPGRHSTR